ncbi:AN1-type zinc finger domain-containing protein [Natronorubrum sp. DTA28]|uniref:AN1-type zinc finger domain-containing protein n=1 Tax=Natronorubrum sp. DTA28 TaxID=3447019 RepID=UPI003F82E556
MSECSVCGEGTNMPYTCNYCGRTHCKKHKLPEKHECPNVAEANSLGPELRREYQQIPGDSPRNRVKTIVVVALVILLAIGTALFLL